MLGIDFDDNNYWIYRFMIDEKLQGKFIDKQAIYLVIKAKTQFASKLRFFDVQLYATFIKKLCNRINKIFTHIWI